MNKCSVFMTRQSCKLLSKIFARGWYVLLKRVPTDVQVQCCVRLEYTGLFEMIVRLEYTGLFEMIVRLEYTRLFEMIVGVLTTCHTQYV